MSLLARLVVLCLFAATPAWAAGTDLKDTMSGAYKLDPAHASINFKIMHLGFSRYTGRFNSFDATLDFDKDKLEASKLEVTIDPASIDTNNPKLEGELKGEAWFNVAKFPQMRFVATKITRTGPMTGTITGDFTMLGVTRPVTLNATFIGTGEHPMTKATVLGFSAMGSLQRSAFGLSSFIPMVGDEVTFTIEAEFNKV